MPKSGLFALKQGESINVGPRSMQEFFVLEECVNYCAQECVDITAGNILLLYIVIADISNSLDNIQVHAKQREEIECFLKENDMLKSSFKAIYIAGLTNTILD